MNHSGEVFMHGRIIEVRYIAVLPTPNGRSVLKKLEEEENKAIKEGFQPFGKPDYIDDLGLFLQKMVRRS